MRFTVATHGHCFDGLACAAVFSRLVEQVEGLGIDWTYRACAYMPSQRGLREVLDGDQNAVLDYRFAAVDQLTWYFDHHLTAFNNQADRDYFDRRRESGRFFYDPKVSSCTKFVSQIAERQFDVRAPELDELVRWADIIDAARFDSAEAAIDRSHPVLRLVNVIEHHCDSEFLQRFVPRLLREPLLDVANSPEVARMYAPLHEKHQTFRRGVERLAQHMGRVVFVDMTTTVIDSIGKFVTYALYPNSAYSVVVGRLPNCVKISVGHNPWSGHELDTDISAICSRYGGGGHPMVGGITFKVEELERAKEVAHSVAQELDGARSGLAPGAAS